MKKRFCMLALLLCLLPAGGCAASFDVLPPSAAAEDTTYPYTTQELYAERDGNRIYGVLYRPQDAGEKLPAVIFSHGFGGTYRVGVPYAQALAEKGYAVYCFDFCGGSYSSQSDGSPLDMSLRTEQEDLEAVICMVQELDFIDADNLFLMGTSQGGAVSAVTAADHPDEIRGLILLYPAFIMAERANELFQSEEEIPDTYSFMWMEVGHDYFVSFWDTTFMRTSPGMTATCCCSTATRIPSSPFPLPSVRSRPSLPHRSKSCRAPGTAFPARTKVRPFV